MAGGFASVRPRWRIAVALLSALVPASAAAGDVDFNRDVLPLLSAHCFACHGPDANQRKAKLRLDVRDGAVGEDEVIVPGQPAKSELIARLTADDDTRMPPPKSGAALTPAQIKTLRDWIEQGAGYSEHWAFVPPRRPAEPQVQDKTWPTNPIDRFILQVLESKKLKPAAKVTKETLIRRATLDLTGLPPTPDEMEAFMKDAAPDTYEKLIDRLLASPHYGERWGRHWLDVARYADSGGFETDIFYGSAWRYRDYVIRALNADKPFDRFVKEQIAGDELYPNDREAVVATGLYAVGPVLQEADMVRGKLDYDWLTDAADTTGAAFLGLTVGCARCHDHKYDPVSQKDYFALQAVFAASDLTDFKADGSVLRTHVALKKTETEFEQARKKAAPKKQFGDYDEFPEIPLRGLGSRSKSIEVRLLKRGELSAPGDVVKPGLPATLAPATDGEKKPWRSELANWVASARNPLTARVIVNRVWQGHFGQGLVRTPNDFGIRGERPTHPELLDWLAVEFTAGEKGKPETAWSLKRLHRLIMLSSTYRMSADVPADTLRADPDNRLFTRFQPRRVEAEAVWDGMRVVAGTLDRTMYGLPVFPPLDARELIGNYKKWPAGPASDANRRAVYVVSRRSFRFPAMAGFDPPESAVSCGQRDCTVVPNQALTMLNNRSVREQAAAFADRLLKETDRSPEAVASRAWRWAYTRAITADERREAVAFLQAREKAAADAPDPRKAAVIELCVALFNTNEFIYLP